MEIFPLILEMLTKCWQESDEFVSSLFSSLDSTLRSGEFKQPAYTEIVHDGLEKVNSNGKGGGVMMLAIDRDYMSAVEKGNTKNAEQMVKAAAKRAG